MTKLEKLQQDAFFIMDGFAFLMKYNNQGKKYLEIINQRNLKQFMICNIYERSLIRLHDTNFSNENKYKVLLFIERNKDIILKEYQNG